MTFFVSRLLIIFSLLSACSSSLFINKEIIRTIDATGSIVRVSTDIKVSHVKESKDSDSSSNGLNYEIIFPNNQAEHLSYINVEYKGKTNPLALSAPVMNANYTIYSVTLEDSSPWIRVETVFTGILEPYPKEIGQNDHQLVLLKDSHVVYSPYPTETQRTSIKLASATVNTFTKRLPSTLKGSTISYGPYKDIPSYEFSPFTIHFVNNKPFAKFSSMVREVEVSHWGNIAMEDIYELKHAGAVLKGGFSRFEYQARRGSGGPSFRNLIATLPSQAHDIYYRDQIGNISTSELRMSKDDIELEIQTRFPIFGGWQTQFYVGYSIPTESALFIDADGRYNLKFDFFTIFQDVWVEDFEIKVVLPEGSSDIAVTAAYASKQSRAIRYTYLDTEVNGGRPVIILSGRNLVEEHNDQVVISYQFSSRRMLVEPLLLVAVFFAFFVMCSILTRINLTGRSQAASAAKKDT